ncbi:MAG: hypothetical protein ACI8QZ_000833 [Chlamydiales bacterium]|jgi:hypothetical protein
MVFSSGEPIDLLLPGASLEGRAVARKLTTFMRLLVQDARSESTAVVVPDPARAADELQRHVTERTLAALDELLGRAISEHLGRDSFAWFGSEDIGEGEAWILLGAMHPKAFPGALPRVGESPLALATRLLEIAGGAGMPAFRVERWRARLLWARAGAGAALQALRACLQVARADPEVRDQGECLGDLAAAELDRGRPGAASEHLAGAQACGALGDRLRVLTDWARLLDARGRPAAAARVGHMRLPGPMLELRADRPEWLPTLPGKGADGGAMANRGVDLGASCAALRDELGASVAVLFARAAGGFTPVDVDCGPDDRERLAEWFTGLEGCCREATHPAHALLLSAEPVIVRASLRSGDPAGRLGLSAGTRALAPGSLSVALAPVLDAAQTLVGWVHLEFSHHLVPTRARLRSVGRALLPRVVQGAGSRPSATGERGVVETLGDPRAAFFAELVESLGVKLAHRRWWGWVHEDAQLALVAGGGKGLRGAQVGAASGLRRALDTHGCFQFSEPDGVASIHGAAASGWSVALLFGDRVVGVLAMESERRADFRAEDVRRLASVARASGLGLVLTSFAHEHRARAGDDVHFSTTSPGFAAFAARLEALRGTRHGVVIAGPAGCGKATLAHWLHRAGADGSALECLHAPQLGVDGLRAWASATPSDVLLSGVEQLDVAGQRELARILERRACIADSPARRGLGRWILTLCSHVAAAGDLIPELVSGLSRLQVSVPGLAQRRSDVPELARFLLRSLARREGLEPARMTDAVCGLLWRQPWPENIRDLSRVLHRWALSCAGREIDAHEAAETWSAVVPPPLRRLAPRSVSIADLQSALFTTRTASARVNKTRAAAYLGWDPDTLVNHMRVAGISGASAGPDSWGSAPAH